jgi:hypothetical protein
LPGFASSRTSRATRASGTWLAIGENMGLLGEIRAEVMPEVMPEVMIEDCIEVAPCLRAGTAVFVVHWR